MYRHHPAQRRLAEDRVKPDRPGAYNGNSMYRIKRQADKRALLKESADSHGLVYEVKPGIGQKQSNKGAGERRQSQELSPVCLFVYFDFVIEGIPFNRNAASALHEPYKLFTGQAFRCECSRSVTDLLLQDRAMHV